MTVGAVLLGYVAAVGLFGPRVLGRAGWPGRAPMLAIVVYLAAAWSVVLAVGLAGLTLAVHATALGGGLSDLIGACVLRLRATYATPGGAVVAGAGLTLAGAVLARTAVTTVTVGRAAGRAGAPARPDRPAGRRPQPALGAVLLDHPAPAAYCVAGRQPTVVLTTGTLRALTPVQLHAVLAHEHAHLAGHHHRLRAAARTARQILPFLPLMREADTQVARLIELHANDVAARTHDPAPLAAALVILATSPAPAPAPALAAATTDTLHRIHRLLQPATPLSPLRQHLLRATATALALAPPLLALTPAVIALALGRVPVA